MAWYDSGNPPICSTSVAQPVSNPSTATLLAEIDSTQLGTAFFSGDQDRIYRVTWIVGADTSAVVQLEAANSTALSASSNTVFIRTPTGQSGQFVYHLQLHKNDRLRMRVNSTFTGSVTAFIQAEPLT
jgi:hypothetical protein